MYQADRYHNNIIVLYDFLSEEYSSARVLYEAYD